jgi:S1-C subfamily serine protease
MVRMGDEVFTIGYAHIGIMELKPKYTKGVISAVTGIKDNPNVFQTTVSIQPGNSGGSLFNEKGEVTGYNNIIVITSCNRIYGCNSTKC